MNKSDVIEAVTEKLGSDRKTATAAVEGIVDVITRAVAKGEKVGISGFGVFEKVDRAARTARNPATGAAVKMKKTSVPKFRPGQGFKDIVSGAKKVSPAGSSAGRAVTARAGSASQRASGVAKAPAKSAPAKAPAKSAATKAPAKSAAVKAPAKSAAVKAPAKSAVKAPAKSAVKAPAKSAVKATAKSAVKAPAKSAVKAPAKSAVKAPAKSAAAKAPAKSAAAKAPAKAVKAPAKKAAKR